MFYAHFLAAGLRQTLPLSIAVPEARTPYRVRIADGWVAVQHADIDQHGQDKRDEQDQRDRATRRLPIGPTQPQPTGRSPFDETLSTLLVTSDSRGWMR